MPFELFRNQTEQGDDFLDKIRGLGDEAIAQEKTRQEKEELPQKERRERAGRGLLGTSAAALGLTGAGILWTVGHALKYGLLGWKLDANGVPRIDKESLKTFDDWYKWAAGTAKS